MKKIRSVLIIDDSESDVFLASHYLEKSGRYQHIWSRENGVEALRVFKEDEKPDEYPPDIILLDINMPGLNGFEFLEAFRELRSDHPPIIFIMVTSSGSSRDIEAAKASGMVKDYIVKPITTKIAEELAEKYGH